MSVSKITLFINKLRYFLRLSMYVAAGKFQNISRENIMLNSIKLVI